MKKKIIITLSGLIFMSLIFFVVKQDKSVRYRIYFSHKPEFSLNKIFGRLPKNYSTNYEEIIINESVNFQLINIIDKKAPFYSNDIILVNKKEKSEKIIKGYPFNILNNQKETVFNYNEYTSQLINLDVFNEYIKLADLHSKQEVIDNFLYLLSNINLSNSYQRIYSINELTSLINNNSIINKTNLIDTEYPIIDIDSIELSTNPNEEVYCWYLNWGLVKFEFKFQESIKEIRLINVKSKVEGIFGNELLNCC